MPTAAPPTWVRRNRFAAWTGYFCVLTGFATLAMALTAAATGHSLWAMVAGAICAACAVGGVTVLATTVRRDHVDHHATPNLLSDPWGPSPPFIRRRRTPRAITPPQPG